MDAVRCNARRDARLYRVAKQALVRAVPLLRVPTRRQRHSCEFFKGGATHQLDKMIDGPYPDVERWLPGAMQQLCREMRKTCPSRQARLVTIPLSTPAGETAAQIKTPQVTMQLVRAYDIHRDIMLTRVSVRFRWEPIDAD